MYFGIDCIDVVVFGDVFNDVEMLCWVGYGVVMGYVVFEVVDVVDEVGGINDEDGVV